MLYASRGIGKTHVALGIAFAVATGSTFLRWQAPTPKRVLYLDGEMPARSMQDRLRSIAAGSEHQPAQGFLTIITPDLQDIAMPDIGTDAGRQALAPYIDNADFVILDNYSTLMPSSRENENDAWGPMQAWQLDLRRRGKAILGVHHAGKDGRQRGSSRREDALDTVINLRRPSDYAANQGARFEVHLEKARSICGEAAEPFEASLAVSDGIGNWIVRGVGNQHADEATELFRSGASVREVAEVLGISKSQVGRLRKEAEEAGLLN
jgi:putative DNA primase/helicase